jgi:hypothetical protein
VKKYFFDIDCDIIDLNRLQNEATKYTDGDIFAVVFSLHIFKGAQLPTIIVKHFLNQFISNSA